MSGLRSRIYDGNALSIVSRASLLTRGKDFSGVDLHKQPESGSARHIVTCADALAACEGYKAPRSEQRNVFRSLLCRSAFN